MSLFCPECQSSYDDESMGVCPADGVRLYRVDDRDPLIGAVIDERFRVDYMLGEGGMGTVYGGVQLSVNREVAIKVLRADLSNRELALERFFREAKTISRLTHPNIVRLVDFGQDRQRDILYLAMELVPGVNLADLLGKGRLRMSFALEVLYQVCGALTEPHAEGVIHRDLKPDNLLLVGVSDSTLQTKVLDFGIARFMESSTQLTGTGMICGTPAYMAPEQAQNETLDTRADLYALGVIFYEMLSGWPPFSGTSSLQIMLKHIQENPPALRDLLPPATLPTGVENLVYRLMSKDAARRPQTAREVRATIDELRARFDIESVRIEPGPAHELQERLGRFVLPKLPRPDYEKSGPTQVLRRETGEEPATRPNTDEAATSVFVSQTPPGSQPGMTAPLTPDGRARVAADGFVPALEAVDAHGATLEAVAPTAPRKTLDESELPSRSTPSRHVETSLRDPVGATVERSTAPPRPSRRLVALLISCTVATVAAAIIVVQRLDAVFAARVDTPSPQQIEPVQPSPTSAVAAPTVDPGAIANLVGARFAAESRIHSAIEATEKAIRPKPPKRPRAATKTSLKKPKPAPEPPAKTAKPTIDQKIEGLLRDDRL